MELYRLPDRQVLRLRSEKALAFLHDVSTQDLSSLTLGAGAFTAFLTDKGKLRGVARAFVVSDDEVLVDGEGEQRLDQVLGPTAPLAGIEVEVERWAGLRVAGDVSSLRSLGMLPPGEPYGIASYGDVLGIRGGWGEEGVDLLGHHVAGPEKMLLDAGATWGDPLHVEEVRIAAGRPRFGIDVDADTHVNETPLLVHAVSFTKGCYPGQESVARIANLGRVKRMLRVLDTSGPIAAGTGVLCNGVSVGNITSSARAHALALIASDVEAGAVVDLQGNGAVVSAVGWP